jgi:hypothetical protein
MNKIELTSNVPIQAPGNISGNGIVSFTGALRYENNTGSFYFDNLKVNSLEAGNISVEKLPKIKKLIEFVAKKYLAKKPVCEFKDDNLKHKLAQAVLKSIRVENKILLVEIGLF